MSDEWKEERTVTVFGAGIAGLTAAHELVTRGFKVQIIEAEYTYDDEWVEKESVERGVGGMARSQFAIAANTGLAGGKMRRLWSGAELLHDKVLNFDDKNLPLEPARTNDLIARLARAITDLKAANALASMAFLLPPPRDPKGNPLPWKIEEDYRAKFLRDELVKHGVKEPIDDMLVPYRKTGTDRQIYFAPGGAIVAAEHGFRFFPSFYRHLFDSMRRTPILVPRDSERTKATAFENLVPTDGLGFARDGKALSFVIPRRAILSLEATRKILNQVLEELEYTVEDIQRFSLKLFKYMTTSTARRHAEYEHASWGAFLDSQRYSDVSRTHIEFGPQMSAALRGSASDARTQGNITVQLLMDQLKPDALCDYTLAGPTTGAWFDHWHEFLKNNQDVEFWRGRLVGFEAKDTGRRDDDTPIKSVQPVVEGAPVKGNFYVLALSLPAMAKLADSFLAAAADAGIHEKLDDIRKVKAFAGDLSTLADAKPKGPLQHLSGIQYYFDQDVRFWRGHTQYLDSAWGLTSIAQPQFWNRVRDPNDEYRSILSVDIGIFDRKYVPHGSPPGTEGKTAWECTADEIARFTWEQIYGHHDDSFKKRYGPHAKFPEPIAYSLDGTLVFDPTRNSRQKSNSSPFLVNKTHEYPTRPGRLTTDPERSKCISRYDVIADRYVLAGTFMQTFTRLTSMEAANESARHAVNALLQVWSIGGDRCDIWDPEDNEVEDLQWFKDLDAKMFERKLPHFVDVLGWSELPDQLGTLHALAETFGHGAHRRGQR